MKIRLQKRCDIKIFVIPAQAGIQRIKIMKKIVLLILLLITVNTFACICTCIETKIGKRDYANANLIIKGKILKVIYDEQSNEKVITFHIYKNYKGDSNKIIEIRTSPSPASCGLSVNNYDKWLLFVYGKDTKYEVTNCDKNVRYNKRPSQDRKSRRIKRKKMKGYIQKIKEFRKLSIINS